MGRGNMGEKKESSSTGEGEQVERGNKREAWQYERGNRWGEETRRKK